MDNGNPDQQIIWATVHDGHGQSYPAKKRPLRQETLERIARGVQIHLDAQAKAIAHLFGDLPR